MEALSHKNTSVFFGILLVSHASFGLTITEAFDKAKTNNPAYLQAQSNYFAEQEKIPQSKAFLYPNIKANVSYATTNESISTRLFDQNEILNNTEESTLSPDNVKLTSLTFDPVDESTFSEQISTSATIDISQSIINRNLWLEYKKSFPQVELAKLNFDAKRTALLKEISTVYLSHLQAKELTNINLSELKEIRIHYDLTAERHRDGLGNKADVLESQTRVHIKNSDILDAQLKISQTQNDLNRLINQPVDDYLKLPDTFSPAPIKSSTPDDWITKAELVAHDLKQVKKNIEIADLDVQKASAEHWPTLTLRGSYDITNLDNETDLSTLRNRKDAIGLYLEVPIFSGWGAKSRVVEASHRSIAAQHASLNTKIIL